MDPFDNGHYKLVKAFLSMVGIWPYLGYGEKRFGISFGVCGLIGFLVPQALYVRKYVSDLDMMFQALPTIITATLITAKTLTLIFSSAKLKMLFNQIREDWESLKDTPELEVLNQLMERGKQLAMRYMLLILVAGSWYLLSPLMAPILDSFSPLNVSRQRTTLHVGYYFVDEEKYYYSILFAQYWSNFTAVMAVFGSDSAYMLLMYHGCAKYALVSYRLRKMVANGKNEEELFRYICLTAKLHIRAKRFTALMISLFTTYLLWDIGLGLIIHSTSCVMVVIYKDEPSRMLPFISIGIAQSFRLFLNSWPAQKLMDHSSEVSNTVYECEWYRTSARVQKLLLFVMMKSQTPCTITVAKLYVINLDSFGTVMRTSMSYCTVMISVHDSTEGK